MAPGGAVKTAGIFCFFFFQPGPSRIVSTPSGFNLEGGGEGLQKPPHLHRRPARTQYSTLLLLLRKAGREDGPGIFCSPLPFPNNLVLPPSWGGWDWLREQGKTKSEFKIALGCLPCPTAVQPIPYMREGEKKKERTGTIFGREYGRRQPTTDVCNLVPFRHVGTTKSLLHPMPANMALLAGKAPNRPNWRRQANKRTILPGGISYVELCLIDLRVLLLPKV